MGTHARITVDMSPEEHMYLKMASAKLGVSMRQFVLEAAFAKMETLEDAWLAKKAHAVLKRLESGEEKTIPWKKFKKSRE